jgi:hypothetical protein
VSGTDNTIVKFTSNSTIGNSTLVDNGTDVRGTNGFYLAVNGAGQDPYGAISVINPTTSSYSYFGMTRAGQIGAGIGITTGNEIWFGAATSGGVGSVLSGAAWFRISGTNAIFNGNVGINGGGLTIEKNGTTSTIYFPAQTNDPGFIQHYESSNTAVMYFSVSDDIGTTDYFAFGANGTYNTIIYTSGRVDYVSWNGYGYAVAATASTFVLRGTSGEITGGYIYGSYFNSSAGNSENPTIGQIWTQNTGDDFLRKSTPAHFRSQVTDSIYVPIRGVGNWNNSPSVIDKVVGLIGWKHYGNGHIIFDASNSTNPTGGTISNANPSVSWTGTYPTLMGWNGTDTYGVRVDIARRVDIEFNNDTNSTYQMLWGSGTLLYGTAGIYCNPSTDTLYTNGDVVAYASSDRALKDNLKLIENAIDKVNQIGGYTFEWNDKQQVYTGTDIGVIAQEIEAILPEIVTTRENGYKAVKYEKLIPVLIEAIKELKILIDKK